MGGARPPPLPSTAPSDGERTIRRLQASEGGAMRWSWWDRWGSLLGVVAVVCWVVSFGVGGSSPDTSDGAAKIPSYYASHSHQVRQIVAWFIFVAGILVFLG